MAPTTCSAGLTIGSRSNYCLSLSKLKAPDFAVADMEQLCFNGSAAIMLMLNRTIHLRMNVAILSSRVPELAHYQPAKKKKKH